MKNFYTKQDLRFELRTNFPDSAVTLGIVRFKFDDREDKSIWNVFVLTHEFRKNNVNKEIQNSLFIYFNASRLDQQLWK